MAPLNQCVTVARAVANPFAEGTCNRLADTNGITAKAVSMVSGTACRSALAGLKAVTV
jgi:hypothetical protein